MIQFHIAERSGIAIATCASRAIFTRSDDSSTKKINKKNTESQEGCTIQNLHQFSSIKHDAAKQH